MPLCYAIMPITTPPDALARYGGKADHFTKVARHIFKPAAETAGYDFKAPTSTSAEVIQAEIIENLEKADLVLCDVSTWNANVFFELGIRVALDRPVAMVRDNLTEHIPFDNSIVNTHMYDASLDIDVVQEQVSLLAAFIATAAGQKQNALWKYFGITQRAKQADVGSPEDARLELITHQLEGLKRTSYGSQNSQPPDIYHELSTEAVRLVSYSDMFSYINFKAVINRLTLVSEKGNIGRIYLAIAYSCEVMYADLNQDAIPEEAHMAISQEIFNILPIIDSVEFRDRLGTIVSRIRHERTIPLEVQPFVNPETPDNPR